jgi:hypothetical protein
MAGLTDNIELISKPVYPLNPYTRQRFSRWILYTIYVRLRESRMVMPPLFLAFIKRGCDINAFAVTQECNIRDYNIERYGKTLVGDTLLSEIRRMLEDLPPINNAELLPNHALGQFSPWLTAYFTYMYSLNPYMRTLSFGKLCRAAEKFSEENPFFGIKQRHIISTLVRYPPRSFSL